MNSLSNIVDKLAPSHKLSLSRTLSPTNHSLSRTLSLTLSPFLTISLSHKLSLPRALTQASRLLEESAPLTNSLLHELSLSRTHKPTNSLTGIVDWLLEESAKRASPLR